VQIKNVATKCRLAIAKCGHKWQYLDNETQTGVTDMHMTELEKAAILAEREAENLEGMAKRFQARGIRVHRIPAILENAANLRAQAKTWRAHGRWSKEVWPA
jgi:hypothetical protein